METRCYPFVPKSTRPLARGQFWSIPLANGRYGAGCVLGTHTAEGRPSSQMFIAGVIHWIGVLPPSAIDLHRRPVIDFAFAHIKAITETGGEILGEAKLDIAHLPSTAESLTLRTWGYGIHTSLAQRAATSAG